MAQINENAGDGEYNPSVRSKVAIFNPKSDQYLCIDESTGEIKCLRKSPAALETFTSIPIKYYRTGCTVPCVALLASNGKYVTCHDGARMLADADVIQDRQTLRLIKTDKSSMVKNHRGRYFIKMHNDKFKAANADGQFFNISVNAPTKPRFHAFRFEVIAGHKDSGLAEWLATHRLSEMMHELSMNYVQCLDDLRVVETEQEVDELIKEMRLTHVIKRKKFKKAMMNFIANQQMEESEVK